MCQFRSEVPGSELSICGRFCHKDGDGQHDEGQGEQEDGLVAHLDFHRKLNFNVGLFSSLF